MLFNDYVHCHTCDFCRLKASMTTQTSNQLQKCKSKESGKRFHECRPACVNWRTRVKSLSKDLAHVCFRLPFRICERLPATASISGWDNYVQIAQHHDNDSTRSRCVPASKFWQHVQATKTIRTVLYCNSLLKDFFSKMSTPNSPWHDQPGLTSVCFNCSLRYGCAKEISKVFQDSSESALDIVISGAAGKGNGEAFGDRVLDLMHN